LQRAAGPRQPGKFEKYFSPDPGQGDAASAPPDPHLSATGAAAIKP